MTAKLSESDGKFCFDTTFADMPDWWLKCSRLRETAFRIKARNRSEIDALKITIKTVCKEINGRNSGLDHDRYMADFVRCAGLDALAEIGDSGDQTLKTLAVEMSRDDSWKVRCGAIKLLAAVGECDSFVIDLLIQTLRSDTDSMVRKTCVECLIQLCSQSGGGVHSTRKIILNELFMALLDEEYEVQSSARASLYKSVRLGCVASDEIVLISSYMTHELQFVRGIAMEMFKCADCDGKDEILISAVILQLDDGMRNLPSKAITAELLHHFIKQGKFSKDFASQKKLCSLDFQISIQCFRSRHPTQEEVRKNALQILGMLELPCSDTAKGFGIDDSDTSCSSTSDQIADAVLHCLNDPSASVVEGAIGVVTVKKNLFRDNHRVIRCLLEVIQRDMNDADSWESDPDAGIGSQSIAQKAIRCLGLTVGRSYFTVYPVLLKCSNHQNSSLRNAVEEVLCRLDHDCECLTVRLLEGPWEERLVCMRQVTYLLSRRGPSFVARFCWHDATAKAGDCVFAVIRHCLGLYIPIKEMRRRVPAVGEGGPSLCDEPVWQQMELAFSCSIRVVDGFTMNTIRRSTGQSLGISKTVEIIVLNGHAYCQMRRSPAHPIAEEQQMHDSFTGGCLAKHTLCEIDRDLATDTMQHQKPWMTAPTSGEICGREICAPVLCRCGFDQANIVECVCLQQNISQRQEGESLKSVVSALLENLECGNVDLQISSVGALGDIVTKGDKLVINRLIKFAHSSKKCSLVCSKAVIRALAQVLQL